MDRSTRPPRHSRVCSSTMDTIFTAGRRWWRRTGSPPPTPCSAHPPSGCRGGAGTEPFAAPALRHPQTFLAPQALHLLVVHGPALAAGVVVGAAESPPRDASSRTPQPPRSAASGSAGVDARAVALGGAVLPGHPAGEPLTDPITVDQVVNGCPPAFRAQNFPGRSPSTPPSPAPHRPATA